VAHLVVVSFRLGGTDGVSIEARKWIEAFEGLGHHVTTLAGDGDGDVIMPELAIRATSAPRLDDVARVLGDADLVVVENFASLPLNVAARDVLYRALDGRRALFRHHDLPWQRPLWRSDDTPREHHLWRHVTINELSRRELEERGVHAVTIRNTFACDPPLGRRDATREVLGVTPERVALMPTRAIPRKNVEAAFAFAEAHNATLWLLGPAEDDYGPTLAALVANSPVRVLRGLPDGFSVHDAYGAADVVVLPSTWEGFGNPVLEAVTHRRPLAVYPYPVLREIESFGFRFFGLDDVTALDAFLNRPDDELLEHNQMIARAHFNVVDLPERLTPLLEALNIKGSQLGSSLMVINDERSPQSERTPHAERRDQLLLVARAIFAERGFQATTMDDIAKEAGFTKPILYQYFESKTELYREIVNQTAEKLLTSLRNAVGEVESPRSKIEVAFRVYFEMVVSETDAFRILFIHSHEGETKGDLRNVELGLVSFLEPLIAVRIKPDHRRQLAAGVVGIAEGAATAWLIQQEGKGWPTPTPGVAERLASRSATLAWGGLRSVELD